MRIVIPFQIIATGLTLLLFWSCGDNFVMENENIEKDSYSFTYNDKSYTLVKEASTWQNAVTYAVSEGGYLAEINNELEQTAIFSELLTNANITFNETNNQFGFAAIWLGGNDLEEEGMWMWNGDNDENEEQFWQGDIDGVAINGLYNNWGLEPDNNGDQDMLCLGLETTPINEAGKWTDLDGVANNLYFLIEFDQ